MPTYDDTPDSGDESPAATSWRDPEEDRRGATPLSASAEQTPARTRAELRRGERHDSRARSAAAAGGSRRDRRGRDVRGTHPQVPAGPGRVDGPASGAGSRRATRAAAASPRQPVGKPAIAGGLALTLGLGAATYAAVFSGESTDAAFVVGSAVSVQTDELARARTVDTTYRAAASVSRNERRTAIVVTGIRTAAALEAKAKEEAERKAREEEERRRLEEIERQREAAIANARSNPRAAARVLMVDYGWTSDAQYNCLVNLWNGESNWNYLAENRGSGAYGIPQSLPGSKMAKFGNDWRTNPITQIKWGLWYIDAVYGSPCNAWSTWQARSPHWY